MTARAASTVRRPVERSILEGDRHDTAHSPRRARHGGRIGGHRAARANNNSRQRARPRRLGDVLDNRRRRTDPASAPPLIGDILGLPPTITLPALPLPLPLPVLPVLPLPTIPLPTLPLLPGNRPAPVPPTPDPGVGQSRPTGHRSGRRPTASHRSPIPDAGNPSHRSSIHGGGSPSGRPIRERSARSRTGHRSRGRSSSLRPANRAAADVPDRPTTCAARATRRSRRGCHRRAGRRVRHHAPGASTAPARSTPDERRAPRIPGVRSGGAGATAAARSTAPRSVTRRWIDAANRTVPTERSAPRTVAGRRRPSSWVRAAVAADGLRRRWRWALVFAVLGALCDRDRRRQTCDRQAWSNVASDERRVTTGRGNHNRVSADTRRRREPPSRVSADTRPIGGNPQPGVGGHPAQSAGTETGCRRTPGQIGGNLDRASADARSIGWAVTGGCRGPLRRGLHARTPVNRSGRGASRDVRVSRSGRRTSVAG